MSSQEKTDWILMSHKGQNGAYLPARLMIKHSDGRLEFISVGSILSLSVFEESAYTCIQGRIKVTIISHGVRIVLSAIPVGSERMTLINRSSTLSALATRAEYRTGPEVSAQSWPANQKLPGSWAGASSKVPLPYRW